MKPLFRCSLIFAALPAFAFAVYAPIPEQEQGKALTYRLGGSIFHDSNIFGAASGEIDSMVYNLTAAVLYNSSLQDQTFLSGSYELSNDHIVDRPKDKNLTSHHFNARFAHAFSSVSNIDLTAVYAISKNPQSLLAGIPLNTDQSLKRGQFDGKYTTAAGQKTQLAVKYRFVDYNYDNAVLSADLDRAENLLGLEASYAMLPETKLVGEYRYQNIAYDVGGNFKDKDSNFLLAGVDHNIGKQTLLNARAGFEDRNRESASDTTVPYLELTGRYTYGDGSFFASGYTYTLEEPSDVDRFTDAKVNRFFVNVQHRLTGAFTASTSLTYEPSQLQGRGGQPDIDETTTRLGLGLSWQPNKNWTVAGNYDLDDIDSDDAARGQNRRRLGVTVRFTY